MKAAWVWGGLSLALFAPLALALASPLLAGRGVPYVAASVAGIAALAVLTLQPPMAAGWLPLGRAAARRWHRLLGAVLVVAVAVHVGGLYLTSPPDALDALLLVSPTPFSVWGVTAMWAVAGTALLVALRGRLGLRFGTWAWMHNALALVVVAGTVIHALQIDGVMEPVTKALACGAALVAGVAAVVRMRVWR